MTCRLPDGFVLHGFGSVPSTNDEARRLAEAGAPAGTVVVAEQQTRGRGRHGRSWASPPGNLYASVLLRPECPVWQTAQLSLVAAVALGDALEQLGPPGLELALKWPNDVLIRRAKVAGILLESGSIAGERAPWVIIGSGVNLAMAPQDTTYPATTLCSQGFPRLTPSDLLETYLGALDGWIRRWRHEGFEAVRSAWCARAFGLGDQIQLRLGGEDVEGRFLDLSETGALLLEQTGGGRRAVTAGDVSIVIR